MRCTIVTEYNAGESALYDESRQRLTTSESTLTVFDAIEFGCTSVSGRYAIVDSDECAIYQCTSYESGYWPDYDCETVWPQKLNEAWLMPEGRI